MSENQNSRLYGIIVTVLLLLSAIIGFFFWNRSQRAIKEREAEKAQYEALAKEKNQIERELDSLSVSYADLRTENETLQGKVTSTAEMVQQREIVIQQIRNSSAKDLADLRAQVASLQKVKTEYETITTMLRTENDQLKAENERLAGENEQLKGEKMQLTEQVGGLAKQLEDQIRKTQSAVFKASSFRVEIERRNDRLTYRAKKARELMVSFDLADVPQQYQGPQKLYMVITDEKGNPVATDNPVKATIYAPTGPVEIQAQQVKAVNLEGTQRLSFVHRFDERLKAGNYVVAIYCDKGLLGASSFRLV